jgi:hypothetical protein
MVAPTFTFRQFNVAGTDPSGFRHLKAGDTDVHASFTKSLGTAADEQLDFGSNDISLSGINSATRVALAHMDASGDLTTEAFNLKYWLPSVTAFDGTVRFNQLRSSGWLQDEVVQNSSAEQTSATLPTSGNLLRQDASGVITGSGDAEVTEWIYMSVFTGNDEAIGLKGGAGQNTFRYRLTVDYF